jgi:homocysteine S-methyltransferase
MISEILILDGGLGTSLIKTYGVKFNDSTPLWTSHLLLSDQETLLRCQKDFGDVPVDIILTATYQVSKEALAGTITPETPGGIPDSRIPGILDDAVKIAEEAKHCSSQVALSIGPYGACMNPCQEYSGKYDSDHDSLSALEAWHSERMKLFVRIPALESRIAYIALETIPRTDEMIAMRKALDATPELGRIPFWMTCVYPGDGEKIPSGASVKEVVQAMLGPGVAKAIPWGIGINCTQVWKLDAILREYEAAVVHLLDRGDIEEWPALVLYPDGTNGEVFNMDIMAWEMPEELKTVDRTPWEQQVAEVVKATKSRGSWRQIVVGGCCQSNADDIRRLRHLLVTTQEVQNRLGEL